MADKKIKVTLIKSPNGILKNQQANLEALGLHKVGSSAVNRYTMMELKDRFTLMNAAFGQKPYQVDSDLNIL